MKFVKQYQCIIDSEAAKKAGEQLTKTKTSEFLSDFKKDILDTVLSTAEDNRYLIQWAIIKLENGDENASQEGKVPSCH